MAGSWASARTQKHTQQGVCATASMKRGASFKGTSFSRNRAVIESPPARLAVSVASTSVLK
jgi:hypothetical protein